MVQTLNLPLTLEEFLATRNRTPASTLTVKLFKSQCRWENIAPFKVS